MNGGEAGGQGKLVPASTRSLSSPSATLIMRGLEFLAEKHIDHAGKLSRKGDKAGAVKQFRKAFRLISDYPVARILCAELLEDMGDIRGAIAEYREILRITSDFDELVHIRIGSALMDAGELSSAIPEFREVIRLEPDYASGHSWLGEALLKSGDYQGAIAAYREAVRLEPYELHSHLGLGQAIRATSEWADSCLEFYIVLRLAKDSLYRYDEETEIARSALRDMGLSDEID